MNGALVTFIAKVEGVVKEKFSGAEPQTPTSFAPPIKIPDGATEIQVFQGALISKFMPFTVHLTGIAKGVTQKRFLRPSTVGPHYSLSPGARPVSRRP